MDLKLTPEESSFRDELRAWLAKNAPKDWAEWRERPPSPGPKNTVAAAPP
jgi:hypothetical protein